MLKGYLKLNDHREIVEFGTALVNRTLKPISLVSDAPLAEIFDEVTCLFRSAIVMLTGWNFKGTVPTIEDVEEGLFFIGDARLVDAVRVANLEYMKSIEGSFVNLKLYKDETSLALIGGRFQSLSVNGTNKSVIEVLECGRDILAKLIYLGDIENQDLLATFHRGYYPDPKTLDRIYYITERLDRNGVFKSPESTMRGLDQEIKRMKSVRNNNASFNTIRTGSIN